MMNTDESDEAWEARLTAARTPEEKLAILRECMPEEQAQASLGRILRDARGEPRMGFCTSVDINDLLAAASTREEKLAVLREYFSEEEAQERLRVAMDEDQGGGSNP